MEDADLFRSLTGQTSPGEEAAVRAWRMRSVDRERRYQELGDLLGITAKADRRPETGPPSVFKLIYEAQRRSTKGTARRFPNLRGHSRAGYTVLAVACALVLGLGIGRWWLAPARRGGVQAVEAVAGATEGTTLTLNDGTVVRLSPGSRLLMSAGADVREAKLEGRAFFAVAHHRGRRFTVRTDAGKVEVLGTRFNLDARKEDLQVAVLEGRVNVAGRGGEREVRAGEMSRVVRGTVLPAVRLPDMRETVRWMGSFLAFQETPLAVAAREIEALYDVRIEITDRRIAEQTITTWFMDEPINHVLEIFCLVAEASCTTVGDLTTVRPKDEHRR